MRCADGIGEPLAFCFGPLIAPDDRRSHDLARIIEEHGAVHLTGKANCLYRARVDIARCKRLADRLTGGAPPVLRFLLCPRSLRRAKCDMLRRRRAGDATVAGNDDGT
jgi:hypothetical protein